MTKAQISWALSGAMVVGILIGYFVAAEYKEPAEPAQPTYQQHLTECVQNYQSLYDALHALYASGDAVEVAAAEPCCPPPSPLQMERAGRKAAEERADEAEARVRELETANGRLVKFWSCPDCAFTFDADHTGRAGGSPHQHASGMEGAAGGLRDGPRRHRRPEHLQGHRPRRAGHRRSGCRRGRDERGGRGMSDPMYDEALRVARARRQPFTAPNLQRVMRIGFAKALRLVGEMEDAGEIRRLPDGKYEVTR